MGLVVVSGVLLWFGVHPWTVLLIVLMLACPAAATVAIVYARRAGTLPPARPNRP